MVKLVTVHLLPSAKLQFQAASPEIPWAEEDFPPKVVELAAYPVKGDEVGDHITGRSWVVESVYWGFGDRYPTLFVT